MPTLEIAIDQPDHARLAQDQGAHRIELCAALSAGGLTPSAGLIALCSEQVDIPVYAMIRPRSGNFVYTQLEIATMLHDIDAAAAYGARGIVTGALDAQGHLHAPHLTALVQRAHAHGLGVTCHRAIDRCTHWPTAFDLLIALGVERVLTSGQQPLAPAGQATIAQMIAYANGRLEVMAGSGVNAANAPALLALGVNALHCTARIPATAPPDSLGFGDNWEFDTGKVASLHALLG